jgi:aromatic-L-amino-acid decarboxylase
MNQMNNITDLETLDPENWEEIKLLGHRMVDEMLEYLRTVRERPAWTKPPASTHEALNKPVPVTPNKLENIYQEFAENILPYNNNNIHPRFWGWVQGGGSPAGMLADMLASGMNTNVSIGDHAPMYVEEQVINWSKQIFGFPENASGILTSGASIANITALVAARNHFHQEIKNGGLHAVNGQMIVYGSSETHNCVVKGVEVIGIGTRNFRKVPVDEKFRIRIDLLKQMISEDRKAGLLPFCIVGNAGTVNTGATDDLDALADIAKQETIWLHIDGAFGAIPKLLPEFEQQLRALSRADSLSFDFHKWLYMNYEVACVLIRDRKIHRDTFSSNVNYLMAHERGISAGPDAFSNYGLELSRGFKALKVWMLLKENGTEKYARIIRRNLEQVQYLAAEINANPKLELLADVPLNIVCFRYNPGNKSQEELNALNKEILMLIHEQGIAIPTYTVLHGNYAIRVAHTNHRSTKEDFGVLLQAVIRIGNGILQN